jgi:2-polyprenyl-3-methyl-5-hydroxy-6-metoxy-1,4-benzoquinol methylase
MKRDQQHKMILSLREHQNVMSGEEKEAFAMMLKRDRDDEDLDSMTLHQLNHLHERYVKKRSKGELEGRWKKLTGE